MDKVRILITAVTGETYSDRIINLPKLSEDEKVYECDLLREALIVHLTNNDLELKFGDKIELIGWKEGKKEWL